MSKKAKKQPRSRATFLWALMLVALLGLIGLSMLENRSDQSATATGPAELRPLQKKVRALLAGFGISVEQSRFELPVTRVEMPAGTDGLVLYHRLSVLISGQNGKIVDGKGDLGSGKMQLAYVDADGRKHGLVFVPAGRDTLSKGQIAIIIDDFGYKRDALVDAFLAFPTPLSYAIIPGLPHSQEIAALLSQQNKTALIHLPMEPMQGRVEEGPFTLLTGLPPAEIASRMRAAIDAIPGAVGINNHMGSRATADSLVMSPAMAEMRGHGLFFVDSRTSPNSVAYRMARRNAIPTAENNIFLDPVDEEAEIVKKLRMLADLAAKRKRAIAIGHPKTNTLAALSKMIPLLQAEGFAFVSLAEFFPPAERGRGL